MTIRIQASQLKTGMIYWDGSSIEVVKNTDCFVFCNLITECGKQVEFKWKKESLIKIEA
jgi:hypothetical protein